MYNIIAHLYESDSYYHEKVNFRLFNFKYQKYYILVAHESYETFYKELTRV